MRKEFGICIAVLCDTNTSVKIYLLTYLLVVLISRYVIAKNTTSESSLPVGFWRLEISDRSQCECGPVQRSEILLKNRKRE